ncbi:Alpha/Beta hydrolase protein [Truncatella angustata]|uniref:Carboxylic ester hydrolase n=1 Tax=Truncatella angustata TaxID=152316 RepID=A0A9P8URL2_9PEZI|nr:Alpha/Beta hydrolase protein [Truncatella angustata]KAH6656949.1 Alpha/Beta hydrolase protein [Truncatella angustata]
MRLLNSIIYGYLIAIASAVLPTVHLDCNHYIGVPTSYGITQWLGLRYAAPPLEALRFSPPADPPCANHIQPANTHGKHCLGTGEDPATNKTSEDCLFLDVYAPTNATAHSKLPVFFHIQGGGFNTNSNPDVDGRGLIAASNYSIVVVSINYRVGPYGFITDGTAIRANNGLRDQRKALDWVQKWISKFGGDSGHVVLGGESAGAASISLQMTAYGGKDFGLFHAAAAESVSFATVLTVNESKYQYDNFAIRLGCVGPNSLDCLRSKSAVELQAENYNLPYPGGSASPLYMWNPVIDNDLLSDYTYRAFDSGKFVKVPVIFGDDTNGGTVFAPSNTSTLAQSNMWLRNQFPRLTLEQLGQIDEFYPNHNQTCPNSGCYWRQLSDAYGEMRYMCPGLFLSTAFTKYGVPQSWAYRYNVEDPTQMAQGYGVPHTVEANAVWGPDNVASNPPASYWPNGTNAGVVPVVQGYWTSFIRSFNPNTYRYPDSAEWVPWNVRSEERLVFQTAGKTEMETVDADLLARCRYWSSIGVDILQ